MSRADGVVAKEEYLPPAPRKGGPTYSPERVSATLIHNDDGSWSVWAISGFRRFPRPLEAWNEYKRSRDKVRRRAEEPLELLQIRNLQGLIARSEDDIAKKRAEIARLQKIVERGVDL